MEQKTLDFEQCRLFVLELIASRNFDNLDELVYYLNYKQDVVRQEFDEYADDLVEYSEWEEVI